MFLRNLNLKSRNITFMCLESFISGMVFFVPIIAIYYEQISGSITGVGIVVATYALSALTFEIPSGAIADLFGRKKAFLLGYALWFIALAFLYFATSIHFLIIYAILDGIVASLFSGSASALIYDTLKEEKKEHLYKKSIGTFHAMWPLGAAIGSLIGGYIATYDLSLTVLATYVTGIAGCSMLIGVKEPNYHREFSKNVLQQSIKSFKIAINSRQIKILLVGGFILWGFGETSHWMDSIYYAIKGIELKYFGVIAGMVFGLSSLGHYSSHYISGKFGNKRTIMVAIVLWIGLFFGSTQLTGWPSIIFFILPAVLFGIRNPIEDDLANKETGSSQRATVLSVINFSKLLSVAIMAPLIGFFSDVYSLNTVFMICSGVMMFSLGAYSGLKEEGNTTLI